MNATEDTPATLPAMWGSSALEKDEMPQTLAALQAA